MGMNNLDLRGYRKKILNNNMTVLTVMPRLPFIAIRALYVTCWNPGTTTAAGYRRHAATMYSAKSKYLLLAIVPVNLSKEA